VQSRTRIFGILDSDKRVSGQDLGVIAASLDVATHLLQGAAVPRDAEEEPGRVSGHQDMEEEGGQSREQHPSVSLAVGMKVVAFFTGRKGVVGWYDCTVVQVDEGRDEYVVDWDDGETKDTKNLLRTLPCTTIRSDARASLLGGIQLGGIFNLRGNPVKPPVSSTMRQRAMLVALEIQIWISNPYRQ